MTELPYRLWMIQRFTKRALCYFVIFPALVVLYPFMTVGNWLYGLFQVWRMW